MDTNTIVQSVLQKAIDGATATKDFLAGQIPDVVHQLLVFKMWEYGLGMAFCCGSIYGAIRFGIWCFKTNPPYGMRDFVGAILFILSVIPATMLIFCLFNFIELLVAPKLWLLEYAAHLVKG